MANHLEAKASRINDLAARRNFCHPQVKQREFRSGDVLITVADFAYEAEKIAIYCDGFAFHGTPEKLAADAQKRNHLQGQGWLVLTFWGQTILQSPQRCEEQIWRAFCHRNSP